MISGYWVKEALNVRWCETSTVVLVSGTTNNGAVVDESKLIGLIVTFCKIKISNCNYDRLIVGLRYWYTVTLTYVVPDEHIHRCTYHIHKPVSTHIP